MIIAINGLSGSGKTTLAKNIAEYIQWPYISAGKFFRAISKKKHTSIYDYSSKALNDLKIDLKVTNQVYSELNKHKNCILEAHGASLIIAEYQEKIDIFLHCSKKIRLNRISKRENRKTNEIKPYIKALDDGTLNRFKKIYHRNLFDFDNYDLIINTSKLNMRQVFDITKHFINMVLK